MKWIRHRRGRQGFTLVELLVVIAIIAMLVAILMPAISNALLAAAALQAKANARSIYVAAYGRSLDETVMYTSQQAFPLSDDFGSSTEYFIYLVDEGILPVQFSFFAPRGVQPYTGTDSSEFGAENNGFCVTADLKGLADDAAEESAPFVFTRNVNISALNEASSGDLRDQMSADVEPFGKRAVAFVTKGGASYDLRGQSLRDAKNFNPTDLTNPVLRP